MHSVSIVIPCYNEENSIETTVVSIHETLKNAHNIKYEIIVVDDGSKDNTANIIKKLDCISIRHDTNRGYGAAIKTGIRYSNYNLIAIIDADKTYPIEILPEMLSYFPECDMVVGARIGENVHISLIRRPAKWFLRTLANYLTSSHIPDLNSGFRIFKKDIVERFWGIFPPGFSFTTTITLTCLSNDYIVKFVPIDYHKREGKSKIKPISDTLNFISLIVRTILLFNPLKIFFPLSLIVLFIGIGIFFYSWLVLNKVMDITVIVVLLSSVQILAIGLIADVIVKRGSFK